MSKKKTFSGNTMTLKDFHGGSIPSDIPLPSAPGVIVRQADRSGFDSRQNAWGNSNRSENHRLRPSSSGSIRNLDDKTPFLTNTAHNIGRNFDEDERKPLDGGSAPRRTVSDESIRAPLVRSENKGEVVGRLGQGVVGGGSSGGSSSSSYSARVVEGAHLSRPLSGGGGGRSFGRSNNAWGVRKEPEPVAASPWGSGMGSGQSAVSKIAQASALDQISSGRWQTKPMHSQADVEVIRPSGSPSGLYGRESDSFSEREYYENSLVRQAERGLVLEEGVRGGVKEISGVERVRSPVLLDGNERSSVLYTNDGQPAYPDVKYGGSESQVAAEVPERPKLKLLPRTKPLEAPEPSGVDYKQLEDASHPVVVGNINGNARYMKPTGSSSEASHGKLGSNEASHVKPAPSSSEAGNRLVERPKLNLKPRSQQLDKLAGSTERERKSLFGGARPRELVLKERGVDDVIKSHDEVQTPSRVKNDMPRTEKAPVHANVARHNERLENAPIDHRTGRGNEKRDQRADIQKADMQRKNWRNENWRNSRETEKQQQQERRPSPETWRKPVDESKSANSGSSGLRFGKAVSAVELAQAFSRSVSEPKPVDQFSGQRALPGRTQIPFSRLTGPASRPQINGY